MDMTGGKEQLQVCSLAGEGRMSTTTLVHLTFSSKAAREVKLKALVFFRHGVLEALVQHVLTTF